MDLAMILTRARAGLALLFLTAGFSQLSAATPGGEQTFDELQIGTKTYRNVTVTTKNSNYVFVVHSAGMANLKVADLPPEVLVKLGYPDPRQQQKIETNAPPSWAKGPLEKLDTPQVKELKAQLLRNLGPDPEARLREFTKTLTPTIIFGALGGLLVLHLVWSFCCMLICQKAGGEPGLLVWLPLFQSIPLLRAAQMSGWWFLVLFIPVLNLIPILMWPFKIANARGKNVLVAILLLLPLTNLLAFLYLAFSNGGPKEKSHRRSENMVLETI